MKNKSIEERIKSGEIIPLSFDKHFKKVFGDNNHIERVNALLSLILNEPISYFEGRTKVVSNEKVLNHREEKSEYLDVVIELTENGMVKETINIEVNLGNKISAERNLLYAFGTLGNSLKVSENYNNIGKLIQINFDNYEIKEENPDIIKEYLFRDKYGNILSDRIEIDHIDIARCYETWYNEDINKYGKYEQRLILFGALMMTRKKEEYEAIIRRMDMEEKDNIANASEEYNENSKAWYIYDNEREKRATYNGNMSLAREEGMKIGEEKGIKETQIATAKRMLEKGLDKELILSITELSEEELEKINI